MLKLPDVLAFTDCLAYLKAVLVSGKDGDNRLGLRTLALKAGFRSPATLSMILNGHRRLTLKAAEKLSGALGLSGRRGGYFLCLAELECVRTSEQKLSVQERALRLRSLSEEHTLSLRQYRSLAIWYYPVIYALVGMQDFQRSAEWIANRLGRNVTIREVRQALGDLLNLGLLQDREGQFVQSQGALSTEDEVRDIGIRRYHQQMLALAVDSLDVPLEQRELNGLTIPLAAHRISEVKDRIRKFRKDLNQYLSQFNDTGEVYQLNIQLFPLTQSRISSGSK